jgi:putative ABC transport system ATP-binding protein
MIKLHKVNKTFVQGDTTISVLKDLDLEVAEGEKVAIIGASGSGKSTLLSIISGMDKPDSGSVLLDGEDLVKTSEKRMAEIRNQEIGIVFQSFELVPSFSALENVMLPLDIARKSGAKETAEAILTELGLGPRIKHIPKALSGGEQQRVAIARAMAANPKVILADEPTGNLDSTTGNKVLEILFEQIKKHNKTLIMITHDLELAKRLDRIVILKDGKLENFNGK